MTLPTDREIDTVLAAVATGTCSVRWALEELGFYYDYCLFKELRKLQSHGNIHDKDLRFWIGHCMKQPSGYYELRGHDWWKRTSLKSYLAGRISDDGYTEEERVRIIGDMMGEERLRTDNVR